MYNFKKGIFLIGLVVVFWGCASSYKNINPSSLNYPERPEAQGITFSYRAGVLTEAGNSKLAKKERKSDFKLIAVEIKNNTGRDLTFADDLELKLSYRNVAPLSSKEIHGKIKQSTPSYLLYLLLTPINVTTYNENTGASSGPIPIGLGVGPIITLLNVALSATANSSLKKELNQNDILNQIIPDGETTYGLIGVPNFSGGTLSLELKN